jgi:tryptophan synthase alpha chain
MTPVRRLEAALAAPVAAGRPGLVAYLTAGWPDRSSFPDLLRAVSQVADAVELGVPFSDPMADGPTIQRTSAEALKNGVTLDWTLDLLADMSPAPACPILLMSYLNPLLCWGLDGLAKRAVAAGVSGMIIPDLPIEECAPVQDALAEAGLGMVQMVTPVTPPARRARLCQAARGFVYAVTVTGITGGEAALPEALTTALSQMRVEATAPVYAGFGIRRAAQVARLAPHVDGVIVGTALLDCIAAGEDPAAFLTSLRTTPNPEVSP